MNLLSSPSQLNGLALNPMWLSEYVSPDIPRHLHILGVVRCMESLLPQLLIPSEWHLLLMQACYLHDISYSPVLNQTNFHPYDGAVFAYKQRFEKPVVAAVLFHSCAYEMAHQGRPDLISIYEEHYAQLDDVDQLFIDLVT